VTVVTFASVKGSPGVTTLACLVGATWPADRRVVVAECDPSGGDLAARFGLSSKRGWPTLATAVRRGGPGVGIEPHLQQLPGGLDVLVGPGGSDGPDGVDAAELLADYREGAAGGDWDVLADMGRLPVGDLPPSGWLARSDAVVVLLRGDATSVLHVRSRARQILDVCGARAVLAVVGGSGYANEKIAEFTGIPVVGNVPFDPAAAAVAAGDQGSERRLSRSFLINSALHLALSLCGEAPDPEGTGEPRPTGRSDESRVATNPSSLTGRSILSLRRGLDRSVRILNLRRGEAPPVPSPEKGPERKQQPDRRSEVSA
jgi:hypothetical protein